MSLKEKIQENLKEALKKDDKALISVLRLLTSALHNKEIEKRTKLSKSEPVAAFQASLSPRSMQGEAGAPSEREKLEELSKLTEEEVIEVISSEAKKRKEAILLVRRSLGEGGEKEKIENFIKKEKKELEVLEKYLPEQLSEEEIKKLAKEAIEKTGAKELKDMGKVMSELMPKVKGKTDGGLVSRIVKELLELNESSIHFDLQ